MVADADGMKDKVIETMHRRWLAMLGGLLVPALLALAALVLASPPQAEAAKPGAKQRTGYPPARLWYRLSLEFEGSLSGSSTAEEGTSEYRRDEAWTLRSERAVRISLMCINRRIPVQPFLVKERVRRNGKRRRMTVGGCGSSTSDNLVPTARFRSAVRGEATEWTIEDRLDRFDCEPFTSEQTMLEPQPLDGLLLSASSATEGLRHSSEPSTAGLAAAPIDVFVESTTCTEPDGTTYTTYGHDGSRAFVPTDHIGYESVIDRRPTAESMRFEIPPRRFGRSIKRRFGPFTQAFDPQRPFDNGAGLMHYAEKDYSYTLKLDPCPRRGRDVGGC